MFIVVQAGPSRLRRQLETGRRDRDAQETERAHLLGHTSVPSAAAAPDSRSASPPSTCGGAGNGNSLAVGVPPVVQPSGVQPVRRICQPPPSPLRRHVIGPRRDFAPGPAAACPSSTTWFTKRWATRVKSTLPFCHNAARVSRADLAGISGFLLQLVTFLRPSEGRSQAVLPLPDWRSAPLVYRYPPARRTRPFASGRC